MTIEEIKELIQVVRETGIAELEVKRGENRVRIKGQVSAQEAPAANATSAPVAQLAGNGALAATGSYATTEPLPAAPKKEDDRNIVVKSPIVGTYYDSPTP